jgi:hypothetical protein
MRKNSVLTETESEQEVDLQKEIEQQREQLKKHREAGPDAGRQKKNKRIIVGLWLASWGGTIFQGVPYFTFAIMLIAVAMFYEAMNIKRDPKKEELNWKAGRYFEWAVFFLSLYWQVPITFP